MEIGSAYALQVCLLQIPAMVAFSAWYAPDKLGKVANTFTYVCPIQLSIPFWRDGYFRLIFPRWDVIVIILSVFLMTYTYIEAKSNYHRGSILILRWVNFPKAIQSMSLNKSTSVISCLCLGFISPHPPLMENPDSPLIGPTRCRKLPRPYSSPRNCSFLQSGLADTFTLVFVCLSSIINLRL